MIHFNVYLNGILVDNCACALQKQSSQDSSPIVLHTEGGGAYWHQIDGIYARTIAEQTK